MKKSFKIERKGELTTYQIVLLIILLVSFVLILIFLFRLNLGGETEKEICHNSVVMKGSAVIPTESIPLKCSTKYVCITLDGACEELTKPEIKYVDSKEEIYSVLSEEMMDCWWMFGEGKVDYIKNEILKKNHCSICSQIYFDKSLSEINGIDEVVSKDELYSYMSEINVPDKEITYLEYLFRTNDLEGLKRNIAQDKNNPERIGTFGNILVGEHYFIVMGITSEINTFGWAIRGAAVGGIAVVTLATFGVGTAGFAAVLIGEAAGAAVGGVIGPKVAERVRPEIGAIILEGDGVDNIFMAPTIQEAESEKFKALNCANILTSLN